MGLLLESPPTDRDLLDRYVLEREESAFAELVDRYADPVRRVCRGILHDDHASDEVVQDTFLLLARKAGVIPWHQSVGKWLNAAAYRLAHKRRCSLARRRSIEQCIPTRSASDGTVDDYSCVDSADPLDRLADRELHGALNDEVESLPPRYRAPLQLCYLEGKTNRQAADVLGWPQGSIARRLARARAILQRRLVLRGFVVASIAFLIAGAWLTLGSRSDRPESIRQMMALFRSTDNRADFEAVLADLAAGRNEAGTDVLTLARQTVSLAERMSERGTATWRQHSQTMGDSARQLASAIEANDRTAVASAANRLRNSCVQCHQTERVERKNQASRGRQPSVESIANSLASRGRQPLEQDIANPLVLRELTSSARQVMHVTLLRGLTPPARQDDWTASVYHDRKRDLANA